VGCVLRHGLAFVMVSPSFLAGSSTGAPCPAAFGPAAFGAGGEHHLLQYSLHTVQSKQGSMFEGSGVDGYTRSLSHGGRHIIVSSSVCTAQAEPQPTTHREGQPGPPVSACHHWISCVLCAQFLAACSWRVLVHISFFAAWESVGRLGLSATLVRSCLFMRARFWRVCVHACACGRLTRAPKRHAWATTHVCQQCMRVLPAEATYACVASALCLFALACSSHHPCCDTRAVTRCVLMGVLPDGGVEARCCPFYTATMSIAASLRRL
jgi:hypothetical protein